MQRIIILIIILPVLWIFGFEKLSGEIYHMKAARADKREISEQYLLKALSKDSHNSIYQLDLATLYYNSGKYYESQDLSEKIIIEQNGDLTEWSIWFFKAIQKLKSNDIYRAKECLERSLYYNPEFPEGRKALESINQWIKQNS